MSEQEGKKGQVDRRTFLKIMGTAGATAAFMSVAQPAALGEAAFDRPLSPGEQPLPVSQDAGAILKAAPKDVLAGIYQGMVTNRKWETTLKDLYVGGKDGLYGAAHLYIGEEAIANGVTGALNKDDFVVGTHRGHAMCIAKSVMAGKDITGPMMAEIFVRQGGTNKGFGGSMHIADMSVGILGADGIVGSSWYIGAGAAYSALLRGTKQVTVAYGGDGASNSEYFFNAVRNAYNYKLPVVFVVENNYWQIAIPMWSNVIGGHSSTYTKGLPVPSTTVDGNDVAEVYAATKHAVDLARAGGGPSVIEGMTYRWYDHCCFAGAKVGVDGAFGLPYRSDSTVKEWMQRDPIPRYKDFLIGHKLMTADELTKIETDADATVKAAVDFARNSPKVNPQDGLLNVYSKGTIQATQFLNAQVPTAYNIDQSRRLAYHYVRGVRDLEEGSNV